MKPTNTILLTFWAIHPEFDLAEVFEMQQLGDNKVYEPQFESGHRRMIVMRARFDPFDMNARMTAFLYAMQNAIRLIAAEKQGARIWGHECWLNGEKMTI